MNTLTAFPDFPPALFIDLAIGASAFDDCCWANGLDPAKVRPWEGDPEFEHRMAAARRAVDDDGRAFAARCRVVVQDNVKQMESIIRDTETTASHRIDAFKTLAKLGRLEPSEHNVAAPGTGLSLTIIAPGGEALVINAAPQQVAAPDNVIDMTPLPQLSEEDFVWVEAPAGA